MGVEKLTHQKIGKNTLRQEAPQTTFLIFLDIFYPPNFGRFEENGVFQQPQAISLKFRLLSIHSISQPFETGRKMSDVGIYRQLTGLKVKFRDGSG